MIFALANPWRMVTKVHLQILANPCESLRNDELQNLAKACETLRNHICEFARKLAKACEIILAKACETLVLLRKHICESLQKYMHFALANPCNLRNLVKGEFIAHPPPGSGQARSTHSISLVILFVIMIPKHIVSVPLSAQKLHYQGMPTNL